MTTKFQQFMDQRQLTQYRLHKMTGLSKSQISEWQRGKHRPCLKSAFRIAVGLKLSIQTVRAELELRECNQNDIAPDGTFVPRRPKPVSGETNDSSRTDVDHCRFCGQLLRKAA